MGSPFRAVGQCRGDDVIGQSSAAHSREAHPRSNFWSCGPFVVVRGGHRGCEHSGELTKTHRICGAPVKLDKKAFPSRFLARRLPAFADRTAAITSDEPPPGALRLRGPSGAKDEFLLAATAQNLRKLAKLIPFPEPSFAL
jgi:hypothetical protein